MRRRMEARKYRRSCINQRFDMYEQYISGDFIERSKSNGDFWDSIGGWSGGVGRRTVAQKRANSSCICTLCLYTFLDLSAYDGLKLCIKGDGSRYKLLVRISCDWDTVAYTIGFDTVKDQWQSVRLPFSSLGPIFRARTVSDAPPFDPSTYVQQVQV
ncbi:hypothetical protein ACS0TY_001693 [Phlomoides rotata]